MGDVYYTWATQDEIDFVDKLGTHGSGASRRELLRKYIQAARARKVWGAVRKRAVLSHALRCWETEFGCEYQAGEAA